MTDVMPSFAAAAGARVAPEWKVDGVNMVDVWTGKAKAPDRTIFWEWETEGGMMLAAMHGDFKLLDIGGNQFMYNVREDPGERRTLAQEYPEVFKQLQAELKAWMATAVTRTSN
jgi:arylsulfatase A-like enzyme